MFRRAELVRENRERIIAEGGVTTCENQTNESAWSKHFYFSIKCILWIWILLFFYVNHYIISYTYQNCYYFKICWIISFIINECLLVIKIVKTERNIVWSLTLAVPLSLGIMLFLYENNENVSFVSILPGSISFLIVFT